MSIMLQFKKLSKNKIISDRRLRQNKKRISRIEENKTIEIFKIQVILTVT